MNDLERDQSSQLPCFSLTRSMLMLPWFSHCWLQKLSLRNQMLSFEKRKMTELGTAAWGFFFSVQNCLLHISQHLCWNCHEDLPGWMESRTYWPFRQQLLQSPHWTEVVIPIVCILYLNWEAIILSAITTWQWWIFYCKIWWSWEGVKTLNGVLSSSKGFLCNGGTPRGLWNLICGFVCMSFNDWTRPYLCDLVFPVFSVSPWYLFKAFYVDLAKRIL